MIYGKTSKNVMKWNKSFFSYIVACIEIGQCYGKFEYLLQKGVESFEKKKKERQTHFMRH